MPADTPVSKGTIQWHHPWTLFAAAVVCLDGAILYNGHPDGAMIATAICLFLAALARLVQCNV